MRFAIKLFVIVLVTTFVVATVSAEVVNERKLLAVIRAGHSDAEIIRAIQDKKIVLDIDLSDQNIKVLQSEGVSETLINALRAKNGESVSIFADPTTPTVTQQSDPSICPSERGVYLRTSTGWVSVPRHIPDISIGKDAWKAGLTAGLSKSESKWVLAGPSAELTTQPDVEFCVRIPTRDVTLAVLESHKNSRDVTYQSVGIVRGNSSRSSKNFRPVDAQEVGGALIIKLVGLELGEYALDLFGRPEYDFSVRPSTVATK